MYAYGFKFNKAVVYDPASKSGFDFTKTILC